MLRARSGAMAVIIALTTPVFLGGVAIAVDVAQWTMARRLMQRQADSSALAAVYAMSQGADINAAVTRDLALNPGFALDTQPVVERGPSVGAYAGDGRAIRVALGTTLRLPFAGIFLPEGARITAAATASLISTGDICVLALENEDVTGIKMTGSSIVDLNCALSTNAVSETAVDAGGASRINASPVIASSGIPPSSSYATGTVLAPYSLAQMDPFADLPDPAFPNGNRRMRVNPNQTASFSPGTYTSVDIKGVANLAPGTYYIDGTDMSINGTATVNGEGVTIVLTSRTADSNPGSVSSMSMNGSATLNLTAPTSGPFEGVLFYRDRRATNTSQRINGNFSSTIRGAIYMPSSTIDFVGNASMNIDCVQLVGRQLVFSGNSTIRNICPEGQGSKAIAGYAVRLVG